MIGHALTFNERAKIHALFGRILSTQFFNQILKFFNSGNQLLHIDRVLCLITNRILRFKILGAKYVLTTTYIRFYQRVQAQFILELIHFG